MSEERAKEQFWKDVENNKPFEFQFSPGYLNDNVEKFTAKGWKDVEK